MHVHAFQELLHDWTLGFVAEPHDVGGRVVSGQRRQVDAGNCSQQPGRLIHSQWLFKFLHNFSH